MATQFGFLAKEYCNLRLPLDVCRSAAGYYIGTMDESGPVSRESLEYYQTKDGAQTALSRGTWNQREHP